MLVAVRLLLLRVAVVLLLLLVPGVPIAGDDVTLPDLVPLAAHPRGGLLLLLDWDRGSGHVLQQEMSIIDHQHQHKYFDGTQPLVVRVPKYVEHTALYL